MARPKLRVQHWVACLESRVVLPVAPDNFYDLLGVGYAHKLPADAELPWSIAQLDMFARFVNGTGLFEFEVRVMWLDAPEGSRTTNVYGPLRVVFRPGESVRDATFRFRNVPIEGLGRYLIELREISPRLRPPLGTEYITMVRQP